MGSGRHLPNVAGCAVGFAAAGSGVGSLVGTALGAAAGVVYAVLARRARRRLPPPEAGPAG